MRELAIAVLVTLAGLLMGISGTNTDSPGLASVGWVVAIIGGCVSIAYAVRALRD